MTTVAAILRHKGAQIVTVEPMALISEVRRSGNADWRGPVLDRAGQMLGIVSERDIVRSLARNGARTLDMTAGQLMTRALEPQTCGLRLLRPCGR